MHRRTFLKSAAALSLAATVRPTAAAAEDPIERARRAALDVLQPSRKNLEHGLALHAESLVFESYGFSPRAALDADVLAAAIEAGAPAAEIDELREEMSMTRAGLDAAERAEYLAAWKASGVTCVFQNAGEEGQSAVRLLKRLARFTYLTDLLRPEVTRAASPADILAAKRQGQRCLYFTGNGVPLAEQWQSVEGELALMRVFFQLGIRMMHITYNRRNMLGDGCAEPANAGLSDFGRQAVAEMNRLGIIPDVAHSGWQTSLETARASSRPVVASHTTCADLYRHIRAKPDAVIRAIADSGGLIGICAVPSFLGGSGDIAAMLDHIDYAVKRFGAERVAIGTDVAYSSRNAAAGAKKLGKLPAARRRWEYFWPPDALKSVDSPSLAWTNWPMFTVGMVERGHSDETIRKILGGNILRVCQESLAPR